MMKSCVIVVGVLFLTSCATRERHPKPDLSVYTVHLKDSVTIWFLDTKSGIQHFVPVQDITDEIIRKWGEGYVSSKLEKAWDGDVLIVRSNTSEYRIPYESIAYFGKTRVRMDYDKGSNRWSITDAQQYPPDDVANRAAPEK